MRSTLAVLFSALLLALAVPAQAQDYTGDALDIIDRSDEVDYTADLFITTGLSAEVMDDEYTLFVPTDRAWGDLPSEVRETLFDPENRDELKEVLAYHVIQDEYKQDDLVAVGEARPTEPHLETVSGHHVAVTTSQEGLLVDDAVIIKPNVEASNGVIHVIDKVLLPPSIDSAAMAH